MTDEEAYQITGVLGVPEGWSVVANTAPTRAFRVIANAAYSTCRVEQLDSSKAKHGIFSWRTVATHAKDLGDEEFAALYAAISDASKKQVKLKEMIKLNEHERKMAMVRAQNPLGNGVLGV